MLQGSHPEARLLLLLKIGMRGMKPRRSIPSLIKLEWCTQNQGATPPRLLRKHCTLIWWWLAVAMLIVQEYFYLIWPSVVISDKIQQVCLFKSVLKVVLTCFKAWKIHRRYMYKHWLDARRILIIIRYSELCQISSSSPVRKLGIVPIFSEWKKTGIAKKACYLISSLAGWFCDGLDCFIMFALCVPCVRVACL